MKIPIKLEVSSYNLTRRQLSEYHEAEESGNLKSYRKKVKKNYLNYSTISEDGGDKQTIQIDISKLPFGTKTIEVVYEQAEIDIRYN